jgi:hypothetical protein
VDIAPDVDAEDAAKRVEINCGIAIVVPVSKILEVLHQPKLFDLRQTLHAEMARQMAGNPD